MKILTINDEFVQLVGLKRKHNKLNLSVHFTMQYKLVLVCFQFLFVALTLAQYPINGTCPTFDQCRDHNIVLTKEKLSGIWYRYSGILYAFQADYKCTYTNFTQNVDATWNFDIYDRNAKTNELRFTHGLFNYSSNGAVEVAYTDCEFLIAKLL